MDAILGVVIMRILSMAAFAIMLSLSGMAQAAETLLWSGIIPDGVDGSPPTISHYFAEQPGDLFYLRTDGEIVGIPVVKLEIDEIDRFYTGKDGSIVLLPDIYNAPLKFAAPWIIPIEDGFLIHLYGFRDAVTTQAVCCYPGDDDPFFYRLQQTYVQNIRVTAFFTDESAGKSFTLTYGGTATPEPATWALMITGFGMVGSALRRRRAIA